MVVRKIFWVSILAIILLTACGANTPLSATQETPSIPGDTLPPAVIAKIKNQINETLGASADQIQIETVEQREWPDSCLGLGGPNESCAQVVTPGWLVAFKVDGHEYKFRADQAGTVIRQEQ